jgi:hypothetical protein
MEKVFSWHLDFKKYGTMKKQFTAKSGELEENYLKASDIISASKQPLEY